MAFEICDAPVYDRLAVDNPAGGTHGYGPLFRDHYLDFSNNYPGYDLDERWQDTALTVAQQMETTATHHGFEQMGAPLSGRTPETNRREMLTTLAVATLVSRFVESRDDPHAVKVSRNILSLVLDRTGPENECADTLYLFPSEAAHVIADPKPYLWYRENNLYVHCTRPLAPSPTFTNFLQARDIVTSLPHMIALRPYLASA